MSRATRSFHSFSTCSGGWLGLIGIASDTRCCSSICCFSGTFGTFTWSSLRSWHGAMCIFTKSILASGRVQSCPKYSGCLQLQVLQVSRTDQSHIHTDSAVFLNVFCFNGTQKVCLLHAPGSCIIGFSSRQATRKSTKWSMPCSAMTWGQSCQHSHITWISLHILYMLQYAQCIMDMIRYMNVHAYLCLCGMQFTFLWNRISRMYW